MPMKKGGACFKEFGPFSLPAADDQCGRGNRSNCMGILGAIRPHHENSSCARFFFFAELAPAGIECRAPVNDPPRDPLVHLRP